MNIPIYRAIDYPESDGKPMAETPIHMQVMWDVINVLIAWFANRRRVYVWGNMFLYYVMGDRRKNVAPDVMVVKGVDKDKEPRRDVFKVWEENNRTPSVTIEITSRKTRREDTGKKFNLYQNVLKVREYFLFDPTGDYLDPQLKGYRLRGGVYYPIRPVDGRLPSRELGLHLEARGERLRLWDPATQKWLPTKQEALEQAQAAQRLEAQAREQAEEAQRREAEARRRAEAERQRAEVERQQAEQAHRRETEARQRAEVERQQAEEAQRREAEARQQAETERQRVEREKEQLLAELEALKGRMEGTAE